jgi:hypothetical protein
MVTVGNLMNAASCIKFLNCLSYLAPGEFLHHLFERWVFLPHDLVQSSCLDSRFLQLLIGTARFDGLMLARIANEQHVTGSERKK